MNKRFTIPFLLLTVLFCIFLVVANMLEVKVVKLGPLSATAGLVVFPISYVINDCIVEVYGFNRARFVIWLGFLMNLVVVLLVQLALVLPPDPVWDGQHASDIACQLHSICVRLNGERIRHEPHESGKPWTALLGTGNIVNPFWRGYRLTRILPYRVRRGVAVGNGSNTHLEPGHHKDRL